MIAQMLPTGGEGEPYFACLRLNFVDTNMINDANERRCYEKRVILQYMHKLKSHDVRFSNSSVK